MQSLTLIALPLSFPLATSLRENRPANYNHHIRLEFGSYVHTHEQHDNTMMARTVGAMCLGPTGNEQGTHYFYSMATGRIIWRSRFTELPIPAEVITRVSEIGRTQGMPPTLTFGNRFAHKLQDLPHKVDDNHDVDYDYASDSDDSADDLDANFFLPDDPDAPDGAAYKDYDLPPPLPDGAQYKDYDLPPLHPALEGPSIPLIGPADPPDPPAADDGLLFEDYVLPPLVPPHNPAQLPGVANDVPAIPAPLKPDDCLEASNAETAGVEAPAPLPNAYRYSVLFYVARCTLVPARGSSRNAIRSPQQSSKNLAKREVGLNPNWCQVATIMEHPANTSI